MGLNLEEVSFHDSEIVRIVENPETDELWFEVMFPVDWENNVFEPRTIVFSDVLHYCVEEGPFHGNPTIIEISKTREQDGRIGVKIETNAGKRTLECSVVSIREDGNKV